MPPTLNPSQTIIGIVGAGTMGAGIALTALYAGFSVVLQDSYPEALARAEDYLKKFLAKKDMADRFERARLTANLEDLSGADVVIEAVIEDLALKRDLFARLDALCPPPAILATNTSTLPVTAIAAATANPERVAGMHFFNPAPLLPLVEVVRAPQTGDAVVETLVALAQALGKEPVITKDTPGFIVNRVARPFYGEALRLLGEGVADHSAIDTVVQLGGGFRMGPFQLMDLIGIDVNAAAMKSMYEQTHGEPRYRPHWIQMQKVQEGALGQKTGRGFYEYKDGSIQAKMPAPPSPANVGGWVSVSESSWAPGLAAICADAGYQVGKVAEPGQKSKLAIIAAGRSENVRELVQIYDRGLPPQTPLLVQSCDVTISEVSTWAEHPDRLVGFDSLFFAGGQAATLVPGPATSEETRLAVDDFVRGLGRLPVWVKESPALILPRIVCMLVNEAAFAHLEGVADADTIDKAMRLGVNYPKGPLAWGKELGYSKVVSVLDHLHVEYGEDRYRACTLLRRWARLL